MIYFAGIFLRCSSNMRSFNLNFKVLNGSKSLTLGGEFFHFGGTPFIKYGKR